MEGLVVSLGLVLKVVLSQDEDLVMVIVLFSFQS